MLIESVSQGSEAERRVVFVLLSWCFTPTETIRLIRDGKWGSILCCALMYNYKIERQL